MYKNDEDTAGIYCARCLANNKRYVGSSRKKLRRTIGHTKALSRIAGYATKPEDDQEGLMTAWFANALMRGYDEHAARARDKE